MSSLNTLLEAAKFLELQELQEKENQAALDAALTKSNGVVKITPPPPLQQPPPTINQVVIATTPTQSSVIHSTNNEKKLQPPSPPNRHRFIQNSFDIINPLYIDEKSNVAKRKPPPLVFRSGTREVHNKLEKHRRAHLKECFDILKKQLPASPDEKKTSNLNILHSAIRYIQTLRKKERELEHEMERLAREKISWQTKLALLKKDLSSRYENIDFNRILSEVVPVNFEENHNNNTESEHEQSDDKDFEELHKNETLIEPLNGVKKMTQQNTTLPILASKSQIKDNVQTPVQTAALSVLPVGYPINQGLVVQKLAIVPKGITDLTPLVPTFITQQQINGKMVPLVNAQYVVGKCPLVVVSTASPRPT